MIDESKAIKAKDIIETPNMIHSLGQQYILLKERSNTTFIEAVNLLGDYGWETVSITVEGTAMYALVSNSNYKRKNG